MCIAVCEVAAPFRRPNLGFTLTLTLSLTLTPTPTPTATLALAHTRCVYGAAADEHALYLAHGGGPVATDTILTRLTILTY